MAAELIAAVDINVAAVTSAAASRLPFLVMSNLMSLLFSRVIRGRKPRHG